MARRRDRAGCDEQCPWRSLRRQYWRRITHIVVPTVVKGYQQRVRRKWVRAAPRLQKFRQSDKRVIGAQELHQAFQYIVEMV